MSKFKALLIINPKSGRPKKAEPSSIVWEAFREFPDYQLEVHQTTGPGNATQAASEAAKASYDLVIAAGGDGSIFEVANGLVGTETSLGVVAVGTENVLAQEMRIPLDPGRAVRHMLSSSPRRIDTGSIGSTNFVCFAGIGFDAEVVHSVSGALKKRFGALAYVLASAQHASAFQKKSHHLTIEVDGTTLETEFLVAIIGNIRKYGGGLLPTPLAQVDDGLLDLCVFPKTSVVKVLGQLLAARRGRHIEMPGIVHLQGKKMTITTKPQEKLQLDGEAWSANYPLTIEAAPLSLKVRF